MTQPKINGIRLNKNYLQVTQRDIDGKAQSRVPLYQALASKGINMVSMTLNTMGDQSFVSGTVSSKYGDSKAGSNGSWEYCPNVCTISIYPHNYRLQFLGFLLWLLGTHRISFHHLVSSNAMLTLIIDQSDCDRVVDVLAENFDLPESHAPFEQEENVEQTQFLKQKYPETRATYVEEKIKTYGITLVPDLNLNAYGFSFERLAEFGQEIICAKDEKDRFFHISVHMASPERIHLYLLTKSSLNIDARQIRPAELLSFHGPHFGDRHSIVSRALNCLSRESIPVLLTDCTGASIHVVLPQGKGEDAKQSLKNIFESP